jgi:hypothetical protein
MKHFFSDHIIAIAEETTTQRTNIMSKLTSLPFKLDFANIKSLLEQIGVKIPGDLAASAVQLPIGTFIERNASDFRVDVRELDAALAANSTLDRGKRIDLKARMASVGLLR